MSQLCSILNNCWVTDTFVNNKDEKYVWHSFIIIIALGSHNFVICFSYLYGLAYKWWWWTQITQFIFFFFRMIFSNHHTHDAFWIFWWVCCWTHRYDWGQYFVLFHIFFIHWKREISTFHTILSILSTLCNIDFYYIDTDYVDIQCINIVNNFFWW